jgi:CBS domain-containing protein
VKIQSILATKGKTVVTIRADASIRDAIAVMVANNLGALVVVDDQKHPQGIISERDIVRESNRTDSFFSEPVSRVMTADVICGSLTDDVEAVLQMMTSGHFRHLPIVEGGELIGVVSIREVVTAQLNSYRGNIDTLETQLMSS